MKHVSTPPLPGPLVGNGSVTSERSLRISASHKIGTSNRFITKPKRLFKLLFQAVCEAKAATAWQTLFGNRSQGLVFLQKLGRQSRCRTSWHVCGAPYCHAAHATFGGSPRRLLLWQTKSVCHTEIALDSQTAWIHCRKYFCGLAINWLEVPILWLAQMR